MKKINEVTYDEEGFVDKSIRELHNVVEVN